MREWITKITLECTKTVPEELEPGTGTKGLGPRCEPWALDLGPGAWACSGSMLIVDVDVSHFSLLLNMEPCCGYRVS